MRTATDPYVAWYKNLPAELQLDVAFVAAIALPNTPLNDEPLDDELPAKFVRWIEQSSIRKYQAVGTVLALIKVTEFFLIEPRGTHEDWDVRWNRIDAKRKRAADEGNEAEATQLAERLLAMPDVSAEWIKSSEQWRKLRRSTLSEDALRSGLTNSGA